jgi:hypothetical protein
MNNDLLVVPAEAVTLILSAIVLFSPSPVFNSLTQRGGTNKDGELEPLYRLLLAIVCIALAAKTFFDLWNLYRGTD